MGLGLGGAGPSNIGVAPSPTQASNLPSPVVKKGRTNTPWTPAEEQRLKQMRDAGNSWSEIAKTFPARTEGSVKKHWYKVCIVSVGCLFPVSSVRLVNGCVRHNVFRRIRKGQTTGAGFLMLKDSSRVLRVHP